MNPSERPDRLSTDERVALAHALRVAPEKQWWNLGAKYRKARQIASEERRRSISAAKMHGLPNAHNNDFDAMRHARWSQRMAQEIDPVTAFFAGAGHEIENTFEGQPLAEAAMDLQNNAEGRRAARDNRAIDPRNLRRSIDEPAGESYGPDPTITGHGWRR